MRWALGDVLWRWRWVGLGIVASKKGAALLKGMVHAGSTCLRRVADGKRRSEVQFNRFLANPKVTVERLVGGWSEATGAAVVGRHVLAIQDTSEINFRTTRTRTRGLGEIGKGVGRGALLHAMVAVDAESEACLGLVAGEVWTRCGRVDVPHRKRPLDQKESRRWIETATAGKRVLGGAATVTMVADREADLYPLWALVPEPGIHVLGRIHHDRSLVGGGTLTTIARQWPLAGTRRMTLRERPGRPEREARLELRFGVVTIARPREASAPALPAQVTLSLIELTEPDPPQGSEPITWRLLTTHTVANTDAAWQIVDWYRARWIIEQLFRLLKKQGLRLEDSQVETAERLLKLVAIAAHAAAVTLQLLQARDGRSGEPASVALTADELGTLDALHKQYSGRTPRQQNPHPRRSLAWAAWLISRLGGWDGYPSSRPPGPITLKIGIDKLRLLAQGWGLRNVCMP
jgi:Transposase DDE domain